MAEIIPALVTAVAALISSVSGLIFPLVEELRERRD